MKTKLFIWLLIPLMLAQSFSTLWIWTVFEANREYIARTQCINRFNEKALACKGQCILMKKIREHDEKEQKNTELKFKEVVFIADLSKIKFEAPYLNDSGIVETACPIYTENYAYQPIFSFFHPPLV